MPPLGVQKKQMSRDERVQMMTWLNLGMTVKEIHQKTGRDETTIRRLRAAAKKHQQTNHVCSLTPKFQNHGLAGQFARSEPD